MTAPTGGVGCAHITPTEAKVIYWAVQGLTERAVALRCGSKRGTVHAHIARIYGKTGVTCRAELSLWAGEHWRCCAGEGREWPRLGARSGGIDQTV